jgi:hypothetical protein
MDEKQPINIELTLTLDEINVALASLAKQPYEAVSGLIDKIRAQAIPQIEKNEAPSTKVEAEAIN